MEPHLHTPFWQAANHLQKDKQRAESPRQACHSCPTNVERDRLSFRWYGGGDQRKQCIYCRVSTCYQRAASRYRTPFSESDKGELESTIVEVYDKWEKWMRSQDFRVLESREDVLTEMRNRHAALMRSHNTPSESGSPLQAKPRKSLEKHTCRECKTSSSTYYFTPLAKGIGIELTTSCMRCRILKSVKKKQALVTRQRYATRKEHTDAWQSFMQVPSDRLRQWKEALGIPHREIPQWLVVSLSNFVEMLESKLSAQIPTWYPEGTPISESSSSSSDEDSASDYSEAEGSQNDQRAKRMANEPPPNMRGSKRYCTNNAGGTLPSPPPSSESGEQESDTPRPNNNSFAIVLPEVSRPPDFEEFKETSSSDERPGNVSPHLILEKLYEENKECVTCMLSDLSKLKELELDLRENILRDSLEILKAHASKIQEAIQSDARLKEIQNDRRKLASWFSKRSKLTSDVEDE